MADEGEGGDSWRGSCLGCGGIFLAFIAVVSIGVVLDERGFDPDRRCGRDESGECLSTTPGSIESRAGGLFDGDVVVRYDDGRRRAEVSFDGNAEPAPGTRVLIEWWDHEIVALVDPADERRYKTYDWPDPWWSWALFFGLCVVVVGAALAAVFGTAAAVGRRRSRRPAPP
jgi:hypothetical protein